jgi:hypothetical protein
MIYFTAEPLPLIHEIKQMDDAAFQFTGAILPFPHKWVDLAIMLQIQIDRGVRNAMMTKELGFIRSGSTNHDAVAPTSSPMTRATSSQSVGSATVS